jgi:hypothetical protein
MNNYAEYKCGEIFPIDGQYPEITYSLANEDNENYVKLISDTIYNKGMLLIQGPSKSGKTLLVTHFMRYFSNNKLWISGSLLTTPHSIWNELANALDLQGNDYQDIQSHSNSIINVIAETKSIIILDDFHQIYTKDARHQTCVYLQTLNKSHIPIFIIGVESPQLRDIDESDTNGRIVRITLGAWSAQPLLEIGRKGFERLGGTFRNLETLAQESLNSPYLMQLLCRTYCEYRGNGTQIGSSERIDPLDVRAILPIAAQHISYIETYAILTSLAVCPEKRLFTRHDGKQGTFNQMILYAFAGNYPPTMPYFDLHLNKLWQRMRTILDPSEYAALSVEYEIAIDDVEREIFLDAEELAAEESETQTFDLLTASIILMNRYYFAQYSRQAARDRIRRDPAIDLKGHRFYIRDPLFLFYLRYSREAEDQFES